MVAYFEIVDSKKSKKLIYFLEIKQYIFSFYIFCVLLRIKCGFVTSANHCIPGCFFHISHSIQTFGTVVVLAVFCRFVLLEVWHLTHWLWQLPLLNVLPNRIKTLFNQLPTDSCIPGLGQLQWLCALWLWWRCRNINSLFAQVWIIVLQPSFALCYFPEVKVEECAEHDK